MIYIYSKPDIHRIRIIEIYFILSSKLKSHFYLYIKWQNTRKKVHRYVLRGEKSLTFGEKID